MPVTIFVVGLNHRTAPVELREQFFLTADNVRLALDTLDDHLDEAVVLSTCNRLELYGVTDDPETGIEAVAALAARTHGLTPDELRPHLYMKTNSSAIEHAMRVASGLDSLVLGEPQILGQVTHALAQAQVADAIGPVLSHVFTGAIHAGKRARAETEISRHTVSISHAAAQLVARQTSHLKSPRVLVVGAGEMAELAARGLQGYGISAITIVGRTLTRATGLAERLNVRAMPWEQLAAEMNETDVVMTATGAPHLVIHAEDVAHAQAVRQGQALLMVDVAVPRDIDQSVTGIPGVSLFDIDDLKDVIDINHARREMAAREVEGIIAQELEQNIRWLQSREIVPVIIDLRHKAEALAEAEIEQALRRLHTTDPHDQAVIEQMAYRIVNKLLHAPTTALKAHAGDGPTSDYAQIVRELFELDAAVTPSTTVSPTHSPTGRAANEKAGLDGIAFTNGFEPEAMAPLKGVKHG